MPESALIPSVVIRQAADEARARSGLGARKFEASVGLSRYFLRGLLDQSRPQVPSVDRADEICRALGITMTIGAVQSDPRSVNGASDSQITSQRGTQSDHAAAGASPDLPRPARAEYFRRVVNARLSALFENIAQTYEKARADGEREMILYLLEKKAASTEEWITSLAESDEPPIEQMRVFRDPDPDASMAAHDAIFPSAPEPTDFDELDDWLSRSVAKRPVVAFVPQGQPRGVDDFPSARPVGVWELEVAAGGGAVNLDNAPLTGYAWFRRDWLDRHALDAKRCAVIRVRGESMEPTLPDGCSVLVARHRCEVRPGEIFVVSTSDGLVIKRAERKGNQWFLASDHPALDSAPWPDDAGTIGEVVWMSRTLCEAE